MKFNIFTPFSLLGKRSSATEPKKLFRKGIVLTIIKLQIELCMVISPFYEATIVASALQMSDMHGIN